MNKQIVFLIYTHFHDFLRKIQLVGIALRMFANFHLPYGFKNKHVFFPTTNVVFLFVNKQYVDRSNLLSCDKFFLIFATFRNRPLVMPNEHVRITAFTPKEPKIFEKVLAWDYTFKVNIDPPRHFNALLSDDLYRYSRNRHLQDEPFRKFLAINYCLIKIIYVFNDFNFFKKSG